MTPELRHHYNKLFYHYVTFYGKHYSSAERMNRFLLFVKRVNYVNHINHNKPRTLSIVVFRSDTTRIVSVSS